MKFGKCNHGDRFCDVCQKTIRTKTYHDRASIEEACKMERNHFSTDTATQSIPVYPHTKHICKGGAQCSFKNTDASVD